MVLANKYIIQNSFYSYFVLPYGFRGSQISFSFSKLFDLALYTVALLLKSIFLQLYLFIILIDLLSQLHYFPNNIGLNIESETDLKPAKWITASILFIKCQTYLKYIFNIK